MFSSGVLQIAALVLAIVAGRFAYQFALPKKGVTTRSRYLSFSLSGVAFIAFLAVFSWSTEVVRQEREVIERELAELKAADPDGYLVAIRRDYGDQRYLDELKMMDTARWEKEHGAIEAVIAAGPDSRSGAIDGTIEEVQAKLAAKKPKELDRETKEQLWIAKAQDAVKYRLKDGRSAEFRNVYFNWAEGAPMACGEVNSKNSFGGFTGYQRFISAGQADLTFLEEEVDDFDAVWARMCTS